jgi:hypothetical protein
VEGDHQEDSVDRNLRHMVEGRIQASTLEKVSEIAGQFPVLQQQVKRLETNQNDTARDVAQIRGWLVGDVTSIGKEERGIIGRMGRLEALAGTANWLLRAGIGAILVKVCSDWVIALTMHKPPTP